MAFEKQGFENVKIKISDQKAWAKMKVDQTKKNKTKKTNRNGVFVDIAKLTYLINYASNFKDVIKC